MLRHRHDDRRRPGFAKKDGVLESIWFFSSLGRHFDNTGVSTSGGILEYNEMAARHHYVSKFHLRSFVDPASTEKNEPWLWVGDCKNLTVSRRAPKNIGWKRGLFDGPAGFADRGSRLEDHLSKAIEGPAAKSLRIYSREKPGQRGAIPPEISRYLAWAAARSLPMLDLFENWIANIPTEENLVTLEAPLIDAENVSPIRRNFCMSHDLLGSQKDVPGEEIEGLRLQGWKLRLSKDDWLELVHVQAWYFQARFFPRLKWIILDAPPGHYFIVSDRPVVWGFDGVFDAAPYLLRHPNVQIVAPLTPSLALFAYHPWGRKPDSVRAADVNRIIANAAHEWIAGPTKSNIREALSIRKNHELKPVTLHIASFL